jgi:hypothetical protein
MQRVKIAVLTVVVTAGFGASLVTHASANRLSFSSLTFRAVITPLVIEQEILGSPVKCNVTLEGRFFERWFYKTRGTRIGLIERAILRRPCEGATKALILNGSERFEERESTVNTLPWSIYYESFSGTLPSITDVNMWVVGFSVLLRNDLIPEFPSRCLYLAREQEPMRVTMQREAFGSGTVQFIANGLIPLIRPEGYCWGSVALRGTGSEVVPGTSIRITVKLI